MAPHSLEKKHSLAYYLGRALWLVLILVALAFIFMHALQYYGFDPDVFGRYWPQKYLLIGHVSGGILALLIGPFQFSSRFRTKYLSIHRNIGKIYIVAILLGSICAIGLAFTVALEFHWTWALSLIGLALPWTTCVLMAYRSIRLKRITVHQDWMIRSYIVTFAFITFRILNDYIMADLPFIERGPTAIWISWSIPLLIGEVFIQWNKK
jgi:uncharacterized membrane protein